MFTPGKGKKVQPEIPASKLFDIIKEARNVDFPWDAVTDPIKLWLKAMAGAINTQPEFLLVSALTITSCLMGPDCVFAVRERHKEPCNLFTLCLCEPGTGKTQAYKIAVELPLSSVSSTLLIHEYTAKGLFDHLKTRGGRGLLCHAEMSSFLETLIRRQTEGNGERQLFCRLHDGDTTMIRTKHGSHGKARSDSPKDVQTDARVVLDKTCMAVGGFCQPQPFLHLYQMLGMSDDGFTDRLSVCLIKPVILTENEIESWNEVLDTFKISNFDRKLKILF